MSEKPMSPAAAKVEAFFAQFPTHTYEKNQVMIQGGETPRSIHYLISGKIRQYDITSKGEKVTLNVFGMRAYYPMVTLFTGVENRYFYEAETDVTVRVAPPDKVLEFVTQNSDVSLDLMKRLYSGVDGLMARMVSIMSGTARYRLLQELIIETKRFGIRHSGGILLELNESDLASRAGMSRETVSREMQKLRKTECVTVNRSGIIVHSLSDLEDLLEDA